MNSIVKWFAKKYALSMVNDALKKATEKADIEKYRAKAQAVILVLNEFLEALKDSEISSDECEAILNKVTELF